MVGAALAGCAAGEFEPASVPPVAKNFARSPVIAILDSGTTPYLPLFASELAGFGDGAIPAPYSTVNITANGSFEEDWETWKSLRPFELYHFAGTRLFGIGVNADQELPPIVDRTGHGTGTSYLAAREASSAIIVAVQVDVSVCTSNLSCIADASVADGMEWIAAQDWIDIVSVSIGLPGNLPDASELHPESIRFLRASEAATRSGKLVLAASGNTVTPTLPSYFAGPPWVVSVGGLEQDRGGESVLASKGVDIVANFSEAVPTGDDGELTWSYGTSLAAPIVAGVIATALAEVWAKNSTLEYSQSAVRDAINASALSVDATAWDPRPVDHGNPLFDSYAGLNVPVVSPHQVGWGYVDGSLASEIARRILDEDTSVGAGREVTASMQQNWQALREQYWALAGDHSNSSNREVTVAISNR
jgi:hypothetical protein